MPLLKLIKAFVSYGNIHKNFNRFELTRAPATFSEVSCAGGAVSPVAPSLALLCGAAAASHTRLGAAVTGGVVDSCALSEVEERLRCLA